METSIKINENDTLEEQAYQICELLDKFTGKAPRSKEELRKVAKKIAEEQRRDRLV